jgi:hypothetical protein
MMAAKSRSVFFAIAVAIVFLCADCVALPSSSADQAPLAIQAPQSAGRSFLRSEPPEKPAWIDTPPKGTEELFFVGVSRLHSAVADARGAARENAFNQVLRFYGEFIQASATEKTSFAGTSRDVINELVSREEEITRFAQAVVSQIGTDKYYTEV